MEYFWINRVSTELLNAYSWLFPEAFKEFPSILAILALKNVYNPFHLEVGAI